ncbi:unnamed protein product [Auanema sp. JU1783]|nr:unnamed protein product [Auanema sp. JU1783]
MLDPSHPCALFPTIRRSFRFYNRLFKAIRVALRRAYTYLRMCYRTFIAHGATERINELFGFFQRFLGHFYLLIVYHLLFYPIDC